MAETCAMQEVYVPFKKKKKNCRWNARMHSVWKAPKKVAAYGDSSLWGSLLRFGTS